MRLAQLRQTDLNLLVVFAVLAEERSVSRAATRLFLSQPSVSRALRRLRDTFHDDLLIRTIKGYEPTPQGERLLRELEGTLPRLDRLIAGASFDPMTEYNTFRIAATDNATSIIAPILCRDVLPNARQVRFSFITWRDDAFDDLAHGRLDLALMAAEVPIPAQLQSETIYHDELVCVVSANASYTRQLTMKQYLAAEHISIGVFDGSQNIPEKRLAAHGHRRRTVLHVPYFGAALRCVIGTPLIATVTRRFADGETHNPKLKILKAPIELSGFDYRMIWHPRVNTDAAHTWLRDTVRDAGAAVTS